MLLLLFSALIYGVESNIIDAKICFPEEFMFGVATASYQIEGAWNVSGKGESIWDRYTHEHPDRVFDHKNGDVADGSYYKYKDDVALMKQLGVGFYRFSMSWPRILPTGLSNEINEDGIRYYTELIEELRANRIIPMVTMYHWDLPQTLQDLGGWTNPVMADYFLDYAKVLLDNFADKVPIWITFNEPLSFCHDGYGGEDAPGGRASGFEDYMCGHNVLRAHGMVYDLYDREYRHRVKGGMGITLDIAWMEGITSSTEDQIAAETARQFMFGWFANPIFSKTGDYPAVMRKRIDANSKKQGFPRSRLPTFTREEVKMIRGSFDFMGVNHYTTYLVEPGDGKVQPHPSYYNDGNVKLYQLVDWPKTNSTWLRVVPWGFRKALNWIKTTYNDPLMLVTENGVSFEPGLKDVKRVQFIDSYLRSLHAAITIDKCRVKAYTYWSLLDNFEWMRGFSERFGLTEVDYDSPDLTRTPRQSFNYYKYVATTGCLPNNYADFTYNSV
ncbi:myrosinase 1-like [Anticarsia gemmatalis]|uniref:myrosinase 1-like n=1 Tax=Anticarsia gemmatalis TaxID=129554 RepID=UPI003F76972F